jgi:hypothetical protein
MIHQVSLILKGNNTNRLLLFVLQNKRLLYWRKGSLNSTCSFWSGSRCYLGTRVVQQFRELFHKDGSIGSVSRRQIVIARGQIERYGSKSASAFVVFVAVVVPCHGSADPMHQCLAVHSGGDVLIQSRTRYQTVSQGGHGPHVAESLTQLGVAQIGRKVIIAPIPFVQIQKSIGRDWGPKGRSGHHFVTPPLAPERRCQRQVLVQCRCVLLFGQVGGG